LRIAIIAVVALAFSSFSAAQTTDFAPKLLLTPQRLRRLQRDRERQTVRWLNFENRVKSVPDSPERGFELALYYAVTHDEKRGRDALQWALAHKCDTRQAALILDWCGALLSEAERQQLTAKPCDATSSQNLAAEIRDALFARIARDGSGSADRSRDLISWLQEGNFQDGEALYAACEYLSALRTTQHVDPRREAREFFSALPAEVLLALKPGEAEHPKWTTHIAALALVSLDPNLEESQYLQAWAMQTQQTLREGPGVAYEFLWADPYLPGVGYENLDPWIYDPSGRLFARMGWDSNACWVNISVNGVAEENCPEGWRKSVQTFGHLMLIPATQPCVFVPHRNATNTAVIIWKLPPHQAVFHVEQQLESDQADGAGMCRLSATAQGKVCTNPDTLKIPHAHTSAREH
jgi:hypothetical protein